MANVQPHEITQDFSAATMEEELTRPSVGEPVAATHHQALANADESPLVVPNVGKGMDADEAGSILQKDKAATDAAKSMKNGTQRTPLLAPKRRRKSVPKTTKT